MSLVRWNPFSDSIRCGSGGGVHTGNMPKSKPTPGRLLEIEIR